MKLNHTMKIKSLTEKEQHGIGYSVRRSNDRTYGSLDIRVYADIGHYSPRFAEIHFQSTMEGGKQWSYYGGEIALSGVESVEGLEALLKAVKRIFKPLPNEETFYFRDATTVLRALIASKAVQVCSDCRESAVLTPVSEVKPAQWRAYCDNYNRYASGGSCHVGCVAESEDEARRLMTIEFAEDKGWSRESCKEAFEAWLAAGRPVLELDRKAPDVTGCAEVLAWIEGEQAKETAKVQSEQAGASAQRARLAAESDAIDASLASV